MIQRREHLRFALEAGESIGIERELRRQDLERDVTTELGIVRAIHVAHAARSEQRHDLVGTETNARRDRHRRPERSSGLCDRHADWICGSRRLIRSDSSTRFDVGCLFTYYLLMTDINTRALDRELKRGSAELLILSLV